METNDRTKGIHRHPTQPFGAVRGVTSRQTHHVLEEPCMTPIRPSRLRPSRLLTSRLGIVAAATIGFAVGAVGFAAAQPDDASPEVMAPPASTDDGPTTSVDDGPTVTSGSTVTTVDDGPVTTVNDDGPVTTVGDDGPVTTVDDDGPTTSVDDGPTVTSGTTVTTVGDGPVTSVDDDGPVTSVDDDGPTTSVDDGPTVTSGTTVTTVDDGPVTSVDDGPVTSVDDGPTTSVASALPEPFTTSYSSSGGSIGVTWSGTAFTLNSVTPAAGFRAEIEHQSWDRVRVDFEGADDDARIEVRINDGRLQFRVD